ncbi:MAG TPA: hypothetical protein VLZ75_08325 [Chitinophagales bacterium]|nr:hypothetical protein [Chitinophagales bacterium]
MLSHDALVSILNNLKDQNPKIEIEETQDQIRIPIGALKLLAKILNETSQGKLVSIVPIAMK